MFARLSKAALLRVTSSAIGVSSHGAMRQPLTSLSSSYCTAAGAMTWQATRGHSVQARQMDSLRFPRQGAMSFGMPGMQLHSSGHHHCEPGWHLPPGVKVLFFPKLSPTMTHGRIVKWHFSEGEQVSDGALGFDLQTDNITEDAYKVGKYAGLVTMEVEFLDEGILMRILKSASEEVVQVGTPIALLCDDETDAEAAAAETRLDFSSESTEDQQNLDVHQIVKWQAYLKADA